MKVKAFDGLNNAVELWHTDGHEGNMVSRFFKYEDEQGKQGFLLVGACDDEPLPETLDDVVQELQENKWDTPSCN